MRAVFLFIMFGTSFPIAYAQDNAFTWQRRRNEARESAQEVMRRIPPIRQRVEQEERNRAARVEERRQVARRYLPILERQGEMKRRQVQQILQSVKDLRITVKNINKVYTDRLLADYQEYLKLLKEFASYQGTESAERDAFQQGFKTGQLHKTVADIAPLRRKIHEAYLREIKEQNKYVRETEHLAREMRLAYHDYEFRIAPYLDAMAQHNIQKLDSVEVTHPNTFARLNQIENYANQRRSAFTRLMRKHFPEIEEQIRTIVAKEVRSDLDEQQNIKTHGQIVSDWHKVVEDLFQRKTSLNQEKSTIVVGCKRKIRPFYDLYLEVLSHREQCSDLDALKRESSPYETGCILLKPLLAEAEAFFLEMAWKKMNLSLFAAKREAPPQHADLISLLSVQKVHRAKGLNPPLLLKAVKLHDQLLDEWNSSKLAAALEEPQQ